MKKDPRLFLVSLVLLALAGCVFRPTLTPTPSPTPPEPLNLSAEEQAYLIRMRRYASVEAIVKVHGLTSAEADVILLELEYITPPPDLQVAHSKVISGYQFIKEGKQVLEKHPRGEEKAEGQFLVDWGIRYLFEFIDDVNLFLESRKTQ